MYASYLVVDDPTTLDTLLSEMNRHFSEIYRCFQDIEVELGLRDAGEIQRYHHIFFINPTDSHKHMRVLKERLMQKSREDPEDCERFIRSYASNLRQAFDTMRDVARRRRDGSALESTVDRLFLVGRVGNLYPLLIAAWQNFGEDSQRKEILRLFEAFVFRAYHVVRYRRDTGRSSLNQLAYQIHRDNLTDADFLQRLRGLNLAYVSDDRFRRNLSGHALLPESRYEDDQVPARRVRDEAPKRRRRALVAGPRADPLIRVRDGAHPAAAPGRALG